MKNGSQEIVKKCDHLVTRQGIGTVPRLKMCAKAFMETFYMSRINPKQKNRNTLAIITTHPIQYYSPWFRHLAEQGAGLGLRLGLSNAEKTNFGFEVFYAHQQTAKGQADAGFGVEFEWDIPLLDGYPHRFLRNVSKRPGLECFGGCDSPEIGRILKLEGFTHLLCIGWHKKVFWQAIWAAKKAGIKVLSRGDSQLGMQGAFWKKIIKELTHRVLLKAFDSHLYVGKRNREYLKHYGVPESRLFFSPHFVDNQWWSERAKRSGKMEDGRSEMGSSRPPISHLPEPIFEKRKTVFLFAGKFIPKKRVMDLLEAAAQVPEAKVLLVGDGPLRPKLEERADHADLKERVEFVGFKNQNELPAYLAAANCLVLPSDGTETWGLIVNEAMACRKPAIVSQACGCAPDLIEEGETGYSYPVGDVDALADRMRRFISNRNQDWPSAVQTKIGNYTIEKATAGLFQAVEKMD
jgi:glycosyltransferase involved in cell wall biosynthesis